LIGQGFTVGSSKQPTQVAIGSSCELSLSFLQSGCSHTSPHTNALTDAHTVAHT